MPDEYLDPRLSVSLPEIPGKEVEVKPVTESIEFEVSYSQPVEFKTSNYIPELQIGVVGQIEFPDRTISQMIVTEVSGTEVKGVLLENPDDWVEAPIFKINPIPDGDG